MQQAFVQLQVSMLTQSFWLSGLVKREPRTREPTYSDRLTLAVAPTSEKSWLDMRREHSKRRQAGLAQQVVGSVSPTDLPNWCTGWEQAGS